MIETPMSIMSIDLDLVDKVCGMIPYNTWADVRDVIVTAFVDNMPSDILLKLTGKPDDCDRAQEIVLSYYVPQERNKDLIIDAFRILGPEYTLDLLDSMELDKYSDYLETST